MAVGKAVRVLDAAERVTGRLQYTIDVKLPDMLHAKVLRSIVPHARITRLDVSAAEQLDGVVAVLTAADFDKPGAPNLIYGMRKKDQPVVAKDRIRYVGEPLAVVAAETLEIAEEALTLIQVEWESLPAVFDEMEAAQPGAPVVHDDCPDNRFRDVPLRYGDINAGFAEADEIIEETYTSPAAQQVCLEPNVSVAQWVDGKLTIWTGTQAPFRVKATLAEMLNVESDKVRLIVPPLGGGFGGKGHIRTQPMVAALAWKVGGRPVKLVNTRDEEFVTVTKHAVTINIRTGVKRDGTFTAREITLYWNGGAYADASPILVGAGMVRAFGPYRIPAVKVDSYGYYTNTPPAAAFRGAMSSQTTWAYESHIDTIAHKLGIDPLEIRLKNLLRNGDQIATGQIMDDVYWVECLEKVADEFGWSESEPENDGGERYKRGRGLGIMLKSTMPTSRSECRIVVDTEGSVTLYNSIVEMGQGAQTALAQITATAVGVPVEMVTITDTDTDITPFDSGTSSARGTNMMGEAILDGGGKLKQMLIESASPILEQSVDRLIAEDGYVIDTAQPENRVPYGEIVARNGLESMEAAGHHETEGRLDPKTGQGIASPHWHQGAGACEVEVDTETGKVTILRYYASSYAGTVVNPTLVKLQNDGNVIFGLGPSMLEEIVFNDGTVANANLADYMVPSMLDIPAQLTSYALEHEGAEFHGIGEMTLPPVAPAIANAIFDATGVRIYDLPLTAERVLRSIRNEPTA